MRVSGADKGPTQGDGMTKLSVAIASYNGARHIGEQLRSIAAQTVAVDEVVVADDNSTDGTREVVAAFAERAPFPVRIVPHERNVGILENFYSAFDACTGDVIFYCDQDDSWRADKVALVSAALAPGVALVAHQSSITDGDLVPTGRVEPANPRYGRLHHPADTSFARMWGHQAAFRRNVLEVMRGLHRRRDPALAPLMESLDPLVAFCAGLVGDLVLLPEPLTAFRRHGGATSGAGADYLGPETRRQQALRAARTDADEARRRLTLLGAAERAGLVGAARADELRRPYGRKLALAEEQGRLAETGGGARLPRLAATMLASARGTGFTNDRRGRNLAMTALLGLGR